MRSLNITEWFKNSLRKKCGKKLQQGILLLSSPLFRLAAPKCTPRWYILIFVSFKLGTFCSLLKIYICLIKILRWSTPETTEDVYRSDHRGTSVLNQKIQLKLIWKMCGKVLGNLELIKFFYMKMNWNLILWPW